MIWEKYSEKFSEGLENKFLFHYPATIFSKTSPSAQFWVRLSVFESYLVLKE